MALGISLEATVAYSISLLEGRLALFFDGELRSVGEQLTLAFYPDVALPAYCGSPSEVQGWLEKQIKQARHEECSGAVALLQSIKTQLLTKVILTPDRLTSLNSLLEHGSELRTWLSNLPVSAGGLLDDFDLAAGPKAAAVSIDRRKQELQGTIATLRFPTPGFAVAKLDQVDEAGNPLSVIGPADSTELARGVDYLFFGRWQVHPTYGQQFAFTSVTRATPTSRSGIQAYTRSVLRETGFNQRHVSKLWGLYANRSLDVLMADPDRVSTECDIKLEICQQAANIVSKDKVILQTKLELHSLLAGKGLARSAVDECLAAWGVKAPEIIRKQPFLLLEKHISGAGFARVDKIFLEQGGDPADYIRQKYCAWHSVISQKDGHTWLSGGEVHGRIQERLGHNVSALDAIKIAIKADLLAEFRTPDGRPWLADAGRADREAAVARMLANLGSVRPARWPNQDSLTTLEPHQREQIGRFIHSPIGILAGLPGSGKSHSSMALICEIIRVHGSMGVAVCAPTGKAAVRCTEIMHNRGIELQACTIHRLLEPSGSSNGGGYGFRRNARNKLPHRYIVLDEASMCDIDIIYYLLSACQEGTHILFVGDPYQLPPVGHGAPLRDMLMGGVPYGLLTQPHRLAGRIATICRDMRDNKFPKVPPPYDLEAGENVLHMEVPTPAAAVAKLQGWLLYVKSTGKYDMVTDVQILTPCNDGSDLSRRSLNEVAQATINPLGHAISGCRFRVSDKVICLNNGWQPVMRQPDVRHGVEYAYDADKWTRMCEFNHDAGRDESVTEFVANGEIGVVLAIAPSSVVVRFSSPQRVVRIPIAKQKDDMDESEESAGWLDLGYVITSHKSQGAEFQNVTIMLDGNPRASKITTRELAYTAFSRGKKLVATIGQWAVLDQWTARQNLIGRKTFLADMLKDLWGRSAT